MKGMHSENMYKYTPVNIPVYNISGTEEGMWTRNQFLRSQLSYLTHHHTSIVSGRPFTRNCMFYNWEVVSILHLALIPVQRKSLPYFL